MICFQGKEASIHGKYLLTNGRRNVLGFVSVTFFVEIYNSFKQAFDDVSGLLLGEVLFLLQEIL